MRRLRAFKTLVIAFVVFSTNSAQNATAGTIADLAWLQGCWGSITPGERKATEHWIKPEGGTMLGLSRTIAGGKTVAFEFMRIVQEDDGEIYFIAKPSGQTEARFQLIKSTNREAIFENPAHDFPQRIIYRREGDSLLGRIEGLNNGMSKAIDFPMGRTSCD